MPNYESNRNDWKDDCCCGSNKKDFKNDDCKFDHHKKDDCCCELNKKDWKDNECECNKNDKDHHDKKEECCCKKSMKEALELLTNATLNSDATFGPFAFIGDSYIVGSPLVTSLAATNDNLDVALTAIFTGFESCNCDLIKIAPTANIFYPVPVPDPDPVATPLGLTVNRASLCDVEAIAFTYTLTVDTTQAEFEADLTNLLDRFKEKCSVKCDECCCNEGIFNSVFSRFSPNRVSLTAGWLAVNGAKVLGRLDNVLVLSSSVVNRIYFVCLDSIGFIG